jgi:putative mRNA 3-end processing factor
VDLITSTDRGLYCAPGDCRIDPSRPVSRAVITHARFPTTRASVRIYVSHRDTARILRKRLRRAGAKDGG